jgi:hypothetical protein
MGVSRPASASAAGRSKPLRCCCRRLACKRRVARRNDERHDNRRTPATTAACMTSSAERQCAHRAPNSSDQPRHRMRDSGDAAARPARLVRDAQAWQRRAEQRGDVVAHVDASKARDAEWSAAALSSARAERMRPAQDRQAAAQASPVAQARAAGPQLQRRCAHASQPGLRGGALPGAAQHTRWRLRR